MKRKSKANSSKSRFFKAKRILKQNQSRMPADEFHNRNLILFKPYEVQLHRIW